ncbi:MAG TPA: LacI family transcriptional regulator [Anaerolineaceae bacterium]|nr:LacI family transcriptional regulator [Anaerolineaceae bacterium]
MSRITIKDVAQAAGVSTTTVSHVVNNTRHVDPDTRQRVIQSMDSMGYHPNFLARSLRRGVSKTIGLIVPDAANLFFAEVARKIEDYGFQQGYSVILGNSDNNPEKQTSYVNSLMAKRVDGMIFISSGGEEKDLARLLKNQVPVVVADRDVPLELADVVLVDNERGGYDATRHLIELGHQRIACITGPHDLSPSMQRIQGYLRALQEFNLEVNPDYITAGDFQFRGGGQAMDRLLKCFPRPDAVFVFNDMMAIGAMNAIREAGLEIPRDISVVGFDDIELSSVITPALTTIAQPFDDIARHATRLLVERMEGSRPGENQRIILKASLVKRESTRKRV